MKKEIRLEELQRKINYRFKDESLLLKALMHRSYVNEIELAQEDNEKLEFLGDSVLNLVTTEYISEKFTKLNEGELSKIKSKIISETVFSEISKDIGLGNYLFLSRGENTSGGRERNSILGDAFEALIGAVFLDSDYYTVRDFALSYLRDKIKHLDEIEGVGDYKTLLQEHIQSVYKITPVYKLVETTGPDHDKVFRVHVLIKNDVIAEGVDKSKKRAEKQAAKKAMKKLGYL